MATDLAEFLGPAIGLNSLLGIPLLLAGFFTGIGVFAILAKPDRHPSLWYLHWSSYVDGISPRRTT